MVDPHRFFTSEIRESENVVRQMSKYSRSREPFEEQYGKRAHTLFKYGSKHLYHTY